MRTSTKKKTPNNSQKLGQDDNNENLTIMMTLMGEWQEPGVVNKVCEVAVVVVVVVVSYDEEMMMMVIPVMR